MAETHSFLTHTEDDDCIVCRSSEIAEFVSASTMGCYALDPTLPEGAIEMSVLVQMAGRLFLQGIEEDVLAAAIKEGIEMAKESKASMGQH